MYLLSDVEAPARWYTSIYSTVTLGPLAGSTHFEEPNAAFFPAAWESPATADAYSGSGVWARQIDAWPELCLPDVDAITVDALRRFYLDDLAACGIIFVMPMPVNAGSVLWLDAATNQCPPVLGRITVLMSGTSVFSRGTNRESARVGPTFALAIAAPTHSGLQTSGPWAALDVPRRSDPGGHRVRAQLGSGSTGRSLPRRAEHVVELGERRGGERVELAGGGDGATES